MLLLDDNQSEGMLAARQMFLRDEMSLAALTKYLLLQFMISVHEETSE